MLRRAGGTVVVAMPNLAPGSDSESGVCLRVPVCDTVCARPGQWECECECEFACVCTRARPVATAGPAGEGAGTVELRVLATERPA